METSAGQQTKADTPEPEQSVGLAARALAHDFNNLLAAIAGHASYLRMITEPGSEVDETAATIEMAAVRAKGLAAQLHQLGAAHVHTPLAPVNLHSVVHEVVTTLRTGQANPAHFSLDLAAQSPTIRGEAGQLHQLVMNLVVNACEAMGTAGGEVAISTATREGGGVQLQVRDSGPGIPQGLRRQVFDLAYSTKPAGGGMGLDIVRRIARAHSAEIEIADNQPRGTVFQLHFPPAA